MRFLFTLFHATFKCVLTLIVFTYVYQTIKPSIKNTSIFPPQLSFLYSVPLSGVGTKFDGFVNLCFPYTLQAGSLCTPYFITIIYFHLRTKIGCPTRRKRTTLMLFILRTKQNERPLILFWDWIPSYFCWFLIRWIRNSNF